MRKIYFTPGPSQLYPNINKYILQALKANICSMSHRSKEFSELYKETVINLKLLLGIPETYSIFFLSSATEAMERILENCVDKYSYHFINGDFSRLFYNFAQNKGKKASFHEVPLGNNFDFAKVSIPNKTELVCFTHNETSSGVKLNFNAIRKYMKKGTSTLFAIDVVSSMPYVDIDYKTFDLVFFSVQKGFGLPAGLGILVVSPRALQKAMQLRNQKKTTPSFHDFMNLKQFATNYQTPETPNVLLIYLLNKVLENMLQKGIKEIRMETDLKANLLYNYFENSPKFEVFVKNSTDRSDTVCVANVLGGSEKLVTYLANRKFIVGSGYKDMKGKQIRIANFPSHSIMNVKELIRRMESF